MMRLEPVHQPDFDFRFVSPFLKRALNRYFREKSFQALDVPCGTGRNIFLLAKYFEEVEGIDLELKYLSAIDRVKDVYKSSSVKLENRDILKGEMLDVAKYDFVCNIHWYNTRLTEQIVNRLKPGALFLLETPGCRGGNYRELPAEDELKMIFKNEDILQFSFVPCNHEDNMGRAGAAKILIRKR